MPVGVAAGVALVAGGAVDVVHNRQRAEKQEHAANTSANSSSRTGLAGKDAAGAQGGPGYVVGVRTGGTALVVRDARDGGETGPAVAAPRGRRFHRVSAARDGSYVVSSYAARRVRFERLDLDDEGRPEELEEIPGVTVAGVSTAYSDLAVNPDGDRIAYVTYRGAAARVDVVSVRTGRHKAWATRLPARVGSLSWAGDTLAFVWNPLRVVGGRRVEARHQVRVLDTRLPSGDLKASKAVLDLPQGGAAVLGRDGRTIVAGHARGGQITLRAFPAGTRGPAKVVARFASAGRVARLDPDRTGGRLLVAGTDGRLYAGGASLPARDLADAAW